MSHIRETREQRIARLQRDGAAFARLVRERAERVKAGLEPPQQTFLCKHGHFLKRTEVDAGDGLTVIYEPCPLCTPDSGAVH